MRAALFHPYSIRITTTVLCLLLLGVLTTAEQGLSNWRQGNALASGSAAAGAVQVLYIPITEQCVMHTATYAFWRVARIRLRLSICLSCISRRQTKRSALTCFERHCLLHQANSADDRNNGTCGYGPRQHQWPFLGGAAFSSHNAAITGLPMNGCGTCWEVQCSAAAANEVNHSAFRLSVLLIHSHTLSIPCSLCPR